MPRQNSPAAPSFRESLRRTKAIRVAEIFDAEALKQLINEAFVVERIAIEGDRIDIQGVHQYLRTGKFLIHEENRRVAGCVYVEKRGDRAYLGLLSVVPSLQRTGLGRRLTAAAEELAVKENCIGMDLRIISARSDVMQPFYEHLGYTVTGTSPLPDSVELKMPCHFIHMSKSLAPREAP